MAIRIRCNTPGFYRAGIAHGADTTWPEGTFSEDQLRLLRAEPKLTVEEVPLAGAGPAEVADRAFASLGGALFPAAAPVTAEAGGDMATDPADGAEPAETTTAEAAGAEPALAPKAVRGKLARKV